MFDATDELTTDLDAMLQSGQAGRELLIEALTEELFSPIHRLAFSILEDMEAAHYAAIQTFITAALNVYRYRSQLGARLWVSGIALNICLGLRLQIKARRAFQVETGSEENEHAPAGLAEILLGLVVDTLGEKTRQVVLLHFLHGFSAVEIATLLRTRENAVYTQLELARRKILEGFQQAAFSEEDLKEEHLDALLTRSLQARWPVVELSATGLEQIQAEIASQTARQGARRRGSIYLKEVILTAVVILAATGLIWGANILSPVPTPVPRPALPTSSPPAAASYRSLPQYIVEPGDTVPLIARKLGVRVEELTEINHLPVNAILTSGRSLLIPRLPIPEVVASPTPVQPVEHRLPPLTSASDPATVHQYLTLSQTLWHTLWADVQYSEFGPQGYVGPPRTYRSQQWISQPGHSLEIFGDLDGDASSATLTVLPWSFSFDLNPTNMGFDTLHTADELLDQSLLSALVFPGRSGWFQDAGSFKVMADDEAAGRPVVVVELPVNGDSEMDNLVWWQLLDPDRLRLWVDSQTGVILRLQMTGLGDQEVNLMQIDIHQIAYDVDFPYPSVFDLSTARNLGFVEDYHGLALPVGETPNTGTAQAQTGWVQAAGHERLNRTEPPEDFDPAGSRLTFQYPEDTPVGEGKIPLRQTVELFAGPYYLGSLEYGDPWATRCVRSQDGRKIAYLSYPGYSMNWSSYTIELRWLDLAHPAEIHAPLDGVEVSSFAFAPDSRRLAYITSSNSSGVGVVYILDTESGENRRLLVIGNAESLVWSPDGKALGMIKYLDSMDAAEARVVDAETGDNLYSTRFRAEEVWNPVLRAANWPAADWPGHEWGVEFPSYPYGLWGCVGEVTGDQ